MALIGIRETLQSWVRSETEKGGRVFRYTQDSVTDWLTVVK